METFEYRIGQCHRLTEDICQFYLAPIHTTMAFNPGQYIMLHLPSGEKAPFSMANDDETMLEFHLRFQKSNPLSLSFYEHLRQQQTITVSGPYGSCLVSSEDVEKPLIFIAGGTGISPHKSMIDALLKQAKVPEIYLYWGISKLEDDYIPEWFKYCQQKIHATMILSEPSVDWSGPTGLVTDYILSHHPNLKAGISFASGPYAMIQVLKEAYIERKILSQLRSDML